MPSMLEHLEVKDGVCRFHPRGECTLVETVDLISSAIAYCRREKVRKLLVNATDLTGVPVPSLVDRFLMVEEWAREAKSMVVVAMVVPPEYIHPKKFGVMVAKDFGLTVDVYTSEIDALAWLSAA
jgi:hypothetical protein